MNTEWVKSSRSGGNGAQCVEVRWRDGTVQVRDSKDPDGPVLTFSPTEWKTFVEGVVRGDLGRLYPLQGVQASKISGRETS